MVETGLREKLRSDATAIHPASFRYIIWTNGLVQILGQIRTSGVSICWVHIVCAFGHIDSDGQDQLPYTCSLIRAFATCTGWSLTEDLQYLLTEP